MGEVVDLFPGQKRVNGGQFFLEQLVELYEDGELTGKKVLVLCVDDDGFVNMFLGEMTPEQACKYMLQGVDEIEEEELHNRLNDSQPMVDHDNVLDYNDK